MEKVLTIFGSWVLSQKTNIISPAKAKDIDVIISGGNRNLPDNFWEMIKFLSQQGKKIDIHFSTEVKGLGIFYNEPFFQGNSVKELKEWLGEKLPKENFEVKNLKNGIAHRIRGVRYFNQDVKIPNFHILTMDKPIVSNSRYDGIWNDGKISRESLIHLGSTQKDGSRFPWARYEGGFEGNSVAAILAALRKLGKHRNSQVKLFQKHIRVFERASEILSDAGLPALEGSFYGPRCNIQGLNELLKNSSLKDLIRKQSNRV